jgi:hypothetical protein
VHGASAERNFLSQHQSPDNIATKLIMNQEWVRYPAYTDRDGWDKLLGNNKTSLIQRGEKQLNYTWQVVKATDYLEYERSGNRDIMQNPNSQNNNALADLVLAELAEGKGRFTDQIINGVFYNCERTSWVLSAHLPAQKSRRSLPDYTENIIDLFSAELGSLLSWTYYFFHAEFDKVDPVISKRLRHELYQKIIVPYRENDYFWWMAFHPRPDGMVNNWNPWTNFNSLQCIALMEDDKVQLSKDVYRSMQSVDKFINYVSADGACEEGPSYWGHAAGKMYDYLQLLYYITGGQITQFDNPMIKNMGEYISRSYVGNNWVVNFADASARFSGQGSLIYRYGKAVNSNEMMQFGALLSKDLEHTYSFGIDFFRVLESIANDAELKQVKPQHIIPEAVSYPETQFYYLSNKQHYFLAAKGGYNAESHNHNDAGTFSLWIDETPVFIDAGVGTYTRQTFGKERYTIWTMRSNYHNLPSINGFEQKFGKNFKATKVDFNAKKKTLAMNIATAYPDTIAAQSWNRSYQLTDRELIIKDKFELRKSLAANKIHFMLWGDIQVNEGEVLIEVQGKKVTLNYDRKAFAASLEAIALNDPRLSGVWGKEIYRLTLKAKKPALKGEYIYKISKK